RPDIHPASLHDALPIYGLSRRPRLRAGDQLDEPPSDARKRRLTDMLFGETPVAAAEGAILVHTLRAGDRTLKKGSFLDADAVRRSEEHTSELQSRENLV